MPSSFPVRGRTGRGRFTSAYDRPSDSHAGESVYAGALAEDSRPNVPVMTRGLAQVLLVVDGVGIKASVVVPSGGERDAASGASQGTTDIGAPFRCFREGDQRRVPNPGL